MIWLSCTSQHSDSDESCGVCFSPPPPPCPLITLLWEIEESEGSQGVVATESKSPGKRDLLDAQHEERQCLTGEFILHIVTVKWKSHNSVLGSMFHCFWGISCSHGLRKLCNPGACEYFTRCQISWKMHGRFRQSRLRVFLFPFFLLEVDISEVWSSIKQMTWLLSDWVTHFFVMLAFTL